MKRLPTYLVAVAIVSLSLLTVGGAGKAMPNSLIVAVLTKIVPEVDHKPDAEEWKQAGIGDQLGYGDLIKTGEKALAVIKFLDKSIVKLREKSELRITKESEQAKGLKDVRLQKGVIGFIIGSQQEAEEFRFTSPTSVAAIRGTRGSFTSTAFSDTLIVTEGTVQLSNTISDSTVSVPEGFTGVSNADGTVSVHPSTAEEVSSAQASIGAGDETKQFELELRDGEGNKKKLKIDFREE